MSDANGGGRNLAFGWLVRWSLGVTLPALLVVFTVLMGGIGIWNHLKTLDASIVASSMRLLEPRMRWLGRQVEEDLDAQRWSQAQRRLRTLGQIPGLSRAYIADREGRILYAREGDWAGWDPRAVPRLEPVTLDPGGGLVELSSDRGAIEGYLRLRVDPAPGAPALLYLRVDLDEERDAVRSDALWAMLPPAVMVIWLLAVLAALLHLVVIRRAGRLIAAAGQIAEGVLDRPLALAGGDELAKIGVALDALAARLALAEAESGKLAQVVEQSSNAIFITTPDGVIEYVNPRFCEVTGYSADEVIGRTPRLLRAERTPDTLHNEIWAAVRAGREWHGEIYNRRRNGEEFCCLEAIHPLRDPQGRIAHFAAICEDISAHKRAEMTIENLALFDPVTALPNRRLLNDRLRHGLAAGRGSGLQLAVVCMDLDAFKDVNDSLGHDVGDELLRRVAGRLTVAVGPDDTVARVSGDEFMVLLTGWSDRDGLAQQVQALRAALVAPFAVRGHQLHLRASVGVSVYPDDGVAAETLQMHAELAMYHARQNGGDACQYFRSELNIQAEQRVVLQGDLRRALVEGELELFYQPQLEIAGDRLVGVEALVRWRHPERGLVLPGGFIGLAEESGLIVPLGIWVLRTACLQAQAWAAAGRPPLRVSVNLSARQFRRRDLLAQVRTILEETGLRHDLLELELTESMVMDEAEHAVAALGDLKRLGVRLAIDDFGTGYSSLGYLKRFPLDVLKIDRSFVRDVCIDGDDAAIARTIISMAHSLRLEVIAEGVEDAEQQAFLAEAGCDLVQGYLHAKPMPAAQFEAWWDARRGQSDGEGGNP